MKPLQNRFNTLRQGRISARREARNQLIIRNNLERKFYKNLKTLFRKFVNVQMFLYKEYGIYQPATAAQTLNEDFIPLVTNHYRRVFKTIFEYNEDKYFSTKDIELYVFGTRIDFDSLISTYFATRQLQLSGISIRMANQISRLIEDGRLGGLALENIANLVSKEIQTISIRRSRLIARTETHNASGFAQNSYFEHAHKQLGIKMKKQWVATNDERTRPAHTNANRQIVDMDEDFMVDGVPMKYAGDSKGGAKNVINCRCVIIYADEQDIVLD